MINIYFDNIVFNLQKYGGISVVWYEMLKRILKDDRFNPIFLETSLNENIFAENLNIPREKKIIIKPYLFDVKRYLPISIKSKDKFLFHSSYYRICNNPKAINITTVHDFLYEFYRNDLKAKLHIYQKKYAILNSQKLICISNNTKNDLLNFFPKIKKDKIEVIYNGVSGDYRPIDQKLNNKNNYYLYVGKRSRYKNFDKAIELTSMDDCELYIVGAELSTSELQLLNSKLSPRKFKLLTGVSNHEMNILYNNAKALLFPSEYEGFGIPIIEAQKAGCPVIAFNASSIPEIIGETPLLLQNFNISEYERCISIINNEKLRSEIIKSGLTNSIRFSWDLTYEKLSNVYIEMFNNYI